MLGCREKSRSVVITVRYLFFVREFSRLDSARLKLSEKGNRRRFTCNLVFHGLPAHPGATEGMKYVHLVPARNYVSDADLTTPSSRSNRYGVIQRDYHGGSFAGECLQKM